MTDSGNLKVDGSNQKRGRRKTLKDSDSEDIKKEKLDTVSDYEISPSK